MGEDDLVNLLNIATDEIMTSGEFDEIMSKYVSEPGILLMEERKYL